MKGCPCACHVDIWGNEVTAPINYLSEFDVHVTVHRDKFLIIKPIRCTNFSSLFWKETLHVSDSSSVHHQESFTVNTAVVYVIQVFLTACKQDQDGTREQHRDAACSCQQTCMTYTTVVCTVKNSW